MVRGELEQRDVGQRDAARLASARREELLLPLRGRDPPHAGGRHQARAAPEERRSRCNGGRHGKRASSTSATRCGRTSSTAASRSRSASISRKRVKPQVDRPVRRLRLGPQRLALHAAVRLLAAGPLLEGAQLHLRERHRRDHAPLRGARDPPGDRARRCRGNVINVYAHSDFGRAFRRLPPRATSARSTSAPP